MKTLRLNLFAILCLSVMTACSTRTPEKSADAHAEIPEEIWDQGIYSIFGTVISVQPLKDGQNVLLKEKNGREYRAMVSLANLGDRAFQYRIFTIGEEIGFRGTLSSANEMKVTEILETR